MVESGQKSTLTGTIVDRYNNPRTDDHTVTQPGETYREEPITWSPDGRLLLATTSDGMLALIDVQTGASISLPFSQGMHAPDWR
jgi:hypothetical protein